MAGRIDCTPCVAWEDNLSLAMTLPRSVIVCRAPKDGPGGTWRRWTNRSAKAEEMIQSIYVQRNWLVRAQHTVASPLELASRSPLASLREA
jgi:hypothetical protein